MGNGIMGKNEAFLRVSAILVLVLTACLVGLNTQTKTIIFTIQKKATFNDMDALVILVYVASVAAGYNLLQLLYKSSASVCYGGKFEGSETHNIYMAWVCFLLDQIAVYITVAANTAALGASLLALTGEEAFQWTKVCDRFTRFCIQIGGSLLCGCVACILMAVISSVSAFKLFRLYSPKLFLRLKTR
ncbi:CASP-like protein [Quillaja saponaria]|uniref:CASP-like protein n=1 Tax=Quillaja saponaria TaxID=32244 RepID=A0AAD7LCT6_QUISA|nr:CASP-like protein [Quillaja saponaria]